MAERVDFVLAVHGGAGNVREGEADYARAARAGIARALEAGGAVLAGGGSALHAVVEAVVVLEDCEAFNAGRGSVLNALGELEMDAAVVEGSRRRAGAVAGLSAVANPVRAALAVLEDERHVLIAGEGARRFARAAGLPEVSSEALVTPFRREQLATFLAAEHAPAKSGGTVGAVARAHDGGLAAATSTGGILAKRPGRVSDSALVGAGTFADDGSCAVSATGDGELFIRAGFAARVDALVRHAGASLAEACRTALAEVAALEGTGGCIAVGRDGAVAAPFDTPGMPRGVWREGEAPAVALASETGDGT